MPDNEGHRLFNDPLPVEIIGGGGGGGGTTVDDGQAATVADVSTDPITVGDAAVPMAAIVQSGFPENNLPDGIWTVPRVDYLGYLKVNIANQDTNLQVEIAASNFPGFGTAGGIPGVSLTPYAEGDQVGSQLNLQTALGGSNGLMVRSATLIDTAKQEAGYTLYLFLQQTNETHADNEPFALSADEVGGMYPIGKITFAAADYDDLGGGSVCQGVIPNGLLPCTHNAAFVGFLVLTDGSPTFAHSYDLVIQLGVEVPH